MQRNRHLYHVDFSFRGRAASETLLILAGSDVAVATRKARTVLKSMARDNGESQRLYQITSVRHGGTIDAF